MADEVRISHVRLTGAGPGDRARGLLGYVKFTLNATVQVDGVTLRRSAAGRLVLSFPARRDVSGWEHPFVRPLDDATRVAIEQQVFAALGLAEAEQP